MARFKKNFKRRTKGIGRKKKTYSKAKRLKLYQVDRGGIRL